jgi:hypothetical protein
MKTFIKKQFHIGRNLKFRGGIGRSFLACVTSALLLSAAATQATTITVANANDSGAGTLRQAILDASPGDTINFAAGITTINLLSDELLIDKNLTINGPGANLLTVQRSSGADFRVFHIDSTSVVANISGLRIANGHAPANFTTDGASGGGIANGGALTIRNCTISGNTSGALFFGRSEGGGIYNRGLITISGSTISGNTAVFGGGIDNAGNATITSCTISANSNGNLGGSEGGGIENGGTVDITSCTISGNSAEGNPGGGIANGGTVRARNTIIALNTAGCSFQGCTPTGLDVSGALTSQNFNLIGNNAGATITPQPADQIGTPGSPIDPLLGPLQNNGGPTETQALLSGSPAIDKGNSSGLSTDQRGFQRPVVYGGITPPPGGDYSDIGAFEVQAQHPAFFTGETALGGGWYYLQFANGTPFGYYNYLTDQNFIYHIDLGFEYLFDANDANHGIYFYDFASSSFFYTSPTLFPDLYDFSLNAWLYYLPDVNNPGRYTHNPRWFYNFATGQWITL